MAELVCGTGDRPAWLQARRQGITATDLPVILGLVTWDSPFALYWRKKGILPEMEASDRMRLGSWLEREIAVEWRRQAGVRTLHPGGLYRSDARPWQLATPDYWIGRGRSDGSQPNSTIYEAVLECKTSATRDGWGYGELPEPHDAEWEHERSKVPAHVRAQVLWQMDTLGVAIGHVAVVFLPSGEFRSYTISHQNHEGGCRETDPLPECAACRDQHLMRGAGLGFRSLLQKDTPPPVDGLQVTTDALRHLHAGPVKGKTAEVTGAVLDEYKMACDDAKSAATRKREAENRIRQEMGDATVAVDPLDGEPVARREVFKRAGYEVGPAEVDRLVRVKPKEDKTDVD